MGGDPDPTDRIRKPTLLGQTHPMFPGDDAVVPEDPLEEEVESFVGVSPDHGILVVVHHQVGVDVAVTGMSEAGHRDACLLLQPAGELHQLDQLGAGHHHVLVELGETGVAQRVGKIAAQLPDRLAGLVVGVVLDGEGLELIQQIGEFHALAVDRRPSSIDLDDEMGVTVREGSRAKVVARSVQREAVRDLEGGRKVPRVENALHGVSGPGEFPEGGGQHGATLGVGNETEGGFADHSEHPFGTDHEADQVEAGLVLVAARAGAEDGAVGQDRLESEHVGTGHPVLQAAWSPGIGGDVAAQRTLSEGGGIGWIVPADLPGGVLEVSGDDPRLNHRHPILRVELEDPVHPRQGEGDASP